MPDTPLNSGFNQVERPVESIPHFNGANCLVVVDVTETGIRAVTQWRQGPMTAGLTDAELADAIVRAIDAAIAARCPTGPLKLQIFYHFSPKPIDDAGHRTREWDQKASVEQALRNIAARGGNSRIKKIYLCAFLERLLDSHSLGCTPGTPAFWKKVWGF